MENKLTIIINGRGGVGKDTIVDIVSKHFDVVNLSSITPIKEIAKMYGGWAGGKELKDRKFLSDLKALFTAYNELPTKYLKEEYNKFIHSTSDVCFMHIREPEEIEKMVKALNGECKTLLIKGRMDDKCYGNKSDDNVENYPYDYVYNNIKPLSEVEEDFLVLLAKIIDDNDKLYMPHNF